MNHLFHTTIATGVLLLMTSCVTRTEPTQPTIEQFFTPAPEPHVQIEPPNWPPHLHTGSQNQHDMRFMQPLDRLILVDDSSHTF